MQDDAISVFVRVVEAGSFSLAARRLGMPKTTVSAKIAGLEKRLGVRLIQRTTRKLQVTEAGGTYFAHCANAVREIELGEAALQSAKGRPHGVLRVTAPLYLGHAVLPCIVAAYVQKYPDVSVDLIVTNRMVDLVGEGVDLAIRSQVAMPDSSLISRRFMDGPSSLWAAPQYLRRLRKAAHPRDLKDAAFICNPAHKSVVLTNGKSDFELPLKGRIQTDDYQAMKSLTKAGEGIGWLPDYLVADAETEGALVRVLPQWRPKARGDFYFLYPSRKYALPKVEAFIQTALSLA